MQSPAKRKFSGWRVLAGIVMTQFIGAGTYILSFGVFLPVMCDELGWSRGITSVSLSLGLLCFGAPAVLWGILAGKFGPRKTIIWGNALLALGMAGMFFVQEAWQAYVLYCLAGLGCGLGGFIPFTMTINNWFIKKRSLAMGLLSVALGLGGFVFPPLIALMIEGIGWRLSWLALAGIILVGASFIGGGLLIRNRPEDIGQLPDGAPVVPDAAGSPGQPPPPEAPTDWTLGQALRNPVIWLFVTFAISICYTTFTINAHQVSHVIDLGYSNVVAATTTSVVSGVGILGSLVFGFAAMKINIRKLAGASSIVMIGALLLLIMTKELPLVFLYAAFFGFCYGMQTPFMPTFVGAYYGRAHYGKIMGTCTAIQMTMAAVGVAVTGAIRDTAGSYIPAFIVMIVMLVVGVITISLAKPPKLPQPRG